MFVSLIKFTSSSLRDFKWDVNRHGLKFRTRYIEVSDLKSVSRYFVT